MKEISKVRLRSKIQAADDSDLFRNTWLVGDITKLPWPFQIMIKNAIKVIKRDKKGGAERIKAVDRYLKAEGDLQRKIVNGVNNWISERRENSLVEKAFSDSKILGWKLCPKLP